MKPYELVEGRTYLIRAKYLGLERRANVVVFQRFNALYHHQTLPNDFVINVDDVVQEEEPNDRDTERDAGK